MVVDPVGAGLEFGLLGPLTVQVGGASVPVPTSRQRAVLAALLANAGRVVSVDELAAVLWGEDLPKSARAGVQNHVMRLRRSLGAAGSRVVTAPPGYLIRVEDGELDVARFEALLRLARAAARDGDWTATGSLAASALGLWRGQALADTGSQVLAAREEPRLAELRWQAVELRVDAELRLGRGRELIGELRQLTDAQPLRERLHALLMLALYRDGRQGEALAAYQHARAMLATELAVEPGAELRELQQQILAADPTLTMTGPAAPTVTVTGSVPRQLPAAVAGFTGRADELAALTSMLDDAVDGGPGTVVVAAIGGTAGVGKTALAIHWAHQVAGNFPDGQLYVNLRGFDPAGAPAAPTEAIRRFLDALGVPAERIPSDPEAQAGLYRSQVAAKSVLIVLDNAQDEQQVRPLLPASPASLVIVTSRSQLGGLAAADGARLLSLDVLSYPAAVQLLASRLGPARVAAEPAAVEKIASLCACLPLALTVAVARAAARPGFPLAALASELADAGGRLDVLDAGDPAASVRAVFSWSTRQLSDESARLFRLLGLHPGPDISIPAAARLTAAAEPDARRQLSELVRAHLITEHVPGRYAFHDLLRAYASDQARAHDGQDERNAAIGRVLDYYLHTAARAARVLNPVKDAVILAPPRPGAAPDEPANHLQAMTWFEAEHQVLVAAVALAGRTGFDGHAWQLPWALYSYLHPRGHWQEAARALRTALAAATRLGDIAARAECSRLLGLACTELGDHDEARVCFTASHTIYERLRDRRGQAKIQHHLGWLAEHRGQHALALDHAQEALRLYRLIGDTTGQAETLSDVGWYHALLGHYQQARTECRRALTLCTASGHRWLEGIIWDSLGYAEHHLGNLAEAASRYQRALALHRQIGDRYHEAETLTHLGDNHGAVGQPADARQAWRQALAILEDLQHPDADQVRVKLATQPAALQRTDA